jgi:hypothetical protein
MKIFAFIMTYLLSTPFWTMQVMAQAKFSVIGVVLEQKGLIREGTQSKQVFLNNDWHSTNDSGGFIFSGVPAGIHKLKLKVPDKYRLIAPQINEIEFKVTDSDMKDFFFVIQKKIQS